VNVTIVEVSPRDGLQNESTILPTEAKVELIGRLVDAGLRRIEAVSFAHPNLVPAMADAEAVMAKVPRREGISYAGLVLNRRGLDRAIAAGVDEINVVVGVSDTFSRRNQNVGTDEAMAAAIDVISQARGLFTTLTLSTAFGCPFEGEVPVDRVIELAVAGARAGAREIALGDTIGVGVPSQVRFLADGINAETDVPLRFHFHNTRNTGFANAVAAVEAGSTVLDASAGGVGGCPFAPAATGNIATEDLVYLLERMGIHTGVDLPALIPTAQFLTEQLGHEVPAMLPRAGIFPDSAANYS
jgi:isopropylmalate/homocitrate/citramalate synthase